MTYLEFIEKFPDDESVAKYLIEKRFKGKIICPFCGKTEKVYHAHYNCRKSIATTVRGNSLFSREPFLRKQECL